MGAVAEIADVLVKLGDVPAANERIELACWLVSESRNGEEVDLPLCQIAKVNVASGEFERALEFYGEYRVPRG